MIEILWFQMKTKGSSEIFNLTFDIMYSKHCAIIAGVCSYALVGLRFKLFKAPFSFYIDDLIKE